MTDLPSAEVPFSIGEPGSAAAGIGPGKPSSPSAAWWPDIALYASSVDRYAIRGASARGIMHRYTGTPRQDACAVSWDEASATLAVAVCDGVGSLDRAHEAADLAARLVVVEALRELPVAAGPDWAGLFGLVSERIVALAVGGSAAPDVLPLAEDVRAARAVMATTVCAAVLRHVDDAVEAHIATVGDSPAFVLSSKEWTLVCGDEKGHEDGGVATNRTSALPHAQHLAPSAVSIRLTRGDALFLMSDGVSDPLGGGGGDVGAALADWWREPPDALLFAAQVQFARQGFLDDRTAVGIWID